MSAWRRRSARGESVRPSRWREWAAAAASPTAASALPSPWASSAWSSRQPSSSSRISNARKARRASARRTRADREIARLQVDPRQPAQGVRLAALVARLATHRQGALEPEVGLGVVGHFERDLAEHQLAFALDLLVTYLAGDRQALLELGPGHRVIAPVQADLAEVQQADGFAEAVADPPEYLLGLVLVCGRLVRIAGLEPGERQRRQGGGDVDLAAQRPPQLEAGLEHLSRLGMVALALGQRRTDVEREGLGDRRGLDRGQRQRRLQELAAFGRVAAEDPEALHRDRELDGDERIDAAREREGAWRCGCCRARPRPSTASRPAAGPAGRHAPAWPGRSSGRSAAPRPRAASSPRCASFSRAYSRIVSSMR